MTADVSLNGLPWIDQIENSFEQHSFIEFHRSKLPQLIDRHGHLVARDLLAAPSLAFRNEHGATFTWSAINGTVTIFH